MSTRLWIALILSVCGALGIWWAVDNLTIEEVKVPAQPKGDALRNPYFITRKLLEEHGAQVEIRQGVRTVPAGAARGGVLLIPHDRRTLGSAMREDLLAWVRSGGHLIVATQAGSLRRGQTDKLLESVGVTARVFRPKRMKREMPLGEADAGIREQDDDESDESRAAPAEDFMPRFFPGLRDARDMSECLALQESGSEAPRFPAQWIRLCSSSGIILASRSEPLWAVSSSRGAHAVSHALGQGRLSVITNPTVFHSAPVAKADHADFLVALLGGDLRNLRVTIVNRDDVDNLGKLAWEHAAGVVIAFALFIFVALWWSATRLGPIATPAVPVRRSVLEHVNALGEFFWREKRPHLLWQATLERTRKQVARKVPRFATDKLLAAHLARRTGLAESDLLFALNPGEVTEPQAFVRAIATLEHLRKSL